MMSFIKTHLECDDCGSSDARSIDDSGWSHCFSCDTRKPVDVSASETLSKPLSATKGSKMIDAITFPAIASEGLQGLLTELISVRHKAMARLFLTTAMLMVLLLLRRYAHQRRILEFLGTGLMLCYMVNTCSTRVASLSLFVKVNLMP